MATTKEMQNYLTKLTTRPAVLVSDVQPTNNTPNTTGAAYKAAQTVNGVKTSTVPTGQTSIQYFGDAPIGLSALNGMGSTTPKASSSSGSGSSGGNASGITTDYKAQLDNLYNNVMNYGSYTPGTYTPGSTYTAGVYTPSVYQRTVDTSGTEAMLNAALGDIRNYGDFKYDLNADLLYQQAIDNYVMQGQRAAQDVMGNASALTGGYGNSYASAVGNQAYQQYITQAHNMIPEFQQAALGIWQSGYDRLLSDYNAVSQQLANLLNIENMNFSIWGANESNAANAFAMNESNRFNAWNANEQNAYNSWLANEQLKQDAWNSGYQQTLDQYNMAKDYYETLQALEKASGGSGGSSSSSNKTSSTSGLPASVQNVLNNATQAQIVTAEDWVKLLDAANKKK